MSLNIKQVLEFLYQNNYHQSYFTLEQESKKNLIEYSTEIQHMYVLLSQGEFKMLLSIINPFKLINPLLFNQLYTFIATQELLENIEKSCMSIEDVIKDMKVLCEYSGKEHIESIYQAIAAGNLNKFDDWSIWKGRINC